MAQSATPKSLKTGGLQHTQLWSATLLATFCIILGSKFFVIGLAGSVVPYWDQWNAEGDLLYGPYAAGGYTPGSLFSAHNEHRIFFTRVTGLLELEILGYWDPIVQMIVNAIIHTCAIVMILVLMGQALSIGQRMAVALFAGILVSIPFSHENLLWGFQSQFYFLLGSSAVSLYLISTSPSWTGRWYLGVVAGVLSFFCMASGAVTLIAAALLCAFQIWCKQRRLHREAFAILLLLALAGAGVLLTPQIAAHQALKAHSITQFAVSLAATSSWPAAPSIFFPLLIYAPLIALAAQLLRERPRLDARIWFCLALGLWVVLQLASIAHARAIAPLASRYFDIHVLGLVLNFAALLYVLARVQRPDRMAPILAFGWVLVISVAVLINAVRILPGEIRHKQIVNETYQDVVTRYVTTRDPKVFVDRPASDFPYPDQAYLQRLLDQKQIRGLLSPELGSAVESRQAVSEGLAVGGIPGLGNNIRIVARLLGYALPLLALLITILISLKLLSVAAQAKRSSVRE